MKIKKISISVIALLAVATYYAPAEITVADEKPYIHELNTFIGNVGALSPDTQSELDGNKIAFIELLKEVYSKPKEEQKIIDIINKLTSMDLGKNRPEGNAERINQYFADVAHDLYNAKEARARQEERLADTVYNLYGVRDPRAK